MSYNYRFNFVKSYNLPHKHRPLYYIILARYVTINCNKNEIIFYNRNTQVLQKQKTHYLACCVLNQECGQMYLDQELHPEMPVQQKVGLQNTKTYVFVCVFTFPNKSFQSDSQNYLLFSWKFSQPIPYESSKFSDHFFSSW